MLAGFLTCSHNLCRKSCTPTVYKRVTIYEYRHKLDNSQTCSLRLAMSCVQLIMAYDAYSMSRKLVVTD